MKLRKTLIFIISLLLSSNLQAKESNSNDFFDHYDFFVPQNWQKLTYPYQGEITFLSPKHSCIIHINYDAKDFIDVSKRNDMVLNYYTALSQSLGQTPKDKRDLKIKKPTPFSLNTFDGFTFDYVNFFEDGRYISGQSYLLFDKNQGVLSVDINSTNYKTRKNCLTDAKKYLKTLKNR